MPHTFKGAVLSALAGVDRRLFGCARGDEVMAQDAIEELDDRAGDLVALVTLLIIHLPNTGELDH